MYPKYAAFSPTRLYVVTIENKVSAFSVTNGTRFWTRTCTADLSRPIVAGGVLYAAISGDRVHTLNAVDGVSLNAPAFAGTVDHPATVSA